MDLNNIDAAGEADLQTYIGSFDTDNQYIAGLSQVQGSAQTYMAAVSPWFFTHFGPDSYNKNVSFGHDLIRTGNLNSVMTVHIRR